MRRLYCRIFGHKWRIIRVDLNNNVIWKVCERCLAGGGFAALDERQFTEWQLKRKEMFDE